MVTPESIGRAVRSEFAMALTRSLIAIGIPTLVVISGYFGKRFLDQFDAVITEVRSYALTEQAHNSSLTASINELRQGMQIRSANRDEQIKDIKTDLNDKEIRIRSLERVVPALSPRSP